MNKKNIISFLLTLLTFVTFSQNPVLKKYVERADEYFNVDNYVSALPLYEEAIKIDSNYVKALYQIAECHRKTYAYSKAENYFKKVLDKEPKNYPLTRYYYARMQKANGKYEKAKISFEKFLGKFNPDRISKSYKELAEKEYYGCLMAINEIRNGYKKFDFNLLENPISSEFNDILPTLYEDSILIISSLKTSIDDEKQAINLEKDNYDQYRYEYKKGEWKNFRSNKDRFDVMNSNFDEISGSITQDRMKYYFTRCNIQNEKTGGVDCGIYVSKNKNDKWQEPKILGPTINSPDSWNGAPSISSSGDTLFFVSNRKGGFGSYDIWYSTLINHDTEDWRKARNLGKAVNTSGRETYPRYYSQEKTLFYSSDGQKGFGEKDIFAARGKGFTEIQNIGMPFNSSSDDFFFELGDKAGYLTSNRQDGEGKDDIYQYLYKSKKALINYIFSKRYQTNFFSIKGRIMDTDGNPSSVTVVLLTDEKGNIIKRVTTDNSGRYNFGDLGDKEGYKVVFGDADMDVVFAEAVPLEVSDNWTIEGELLDLYGSSSLKSNGPVGRALFETVYYNFGSNKVRSEGKKSLEELIKFYKKHPNIEIVIHTHTDNYGSKEANRTLAKKRGDNIKNYLTSNGIKESVIIIKSFGESNPIASNKSHKGRQLNRRSDIYIQGGDLKYESKYTTYIVEPRKTIKQVAKKFNMSVTELKELNGLKSNILISYKPLRVRRLNTLPVRGYTPKTKEEKYKKYMNSAGGNVAYGNDDKSGYYTVLPKNTLFSISRLFNIEVAELMKLNKLKNPTIKIGQKLRLKESVPFIPFVLEKE